MIKESLRTKRPAKLEMRAEKFLNKKLSEIKKTSPRKVRNLFEDLQIYQTELELRNKELCSAQLELKSALDRYSDLFEFAPVGIFSVNEQRMVVEVNLIGASLLEEERTSLIGMPFPHFISKDSLETFELSCKQLLKKKAKQRCKLKLLRKDNSELFCQLECSISLSADGEFKQIIMAVTKISERKLFEEALRGSEMKLKTIFENANDEIVYLDQGGTILEDDNKVDDIFVYVAEEVIGK